MQQISSDAETIITQFLNLLTKGNAHVTLDEALKNIPLKLLDKKPDGLPFSIWQIAEHIRIAQWDILEFSRNAKHKSPKWPDEYWPENNSVSGSEWEKCIHDIKKDRNNFIELVKSKRHHLFEPFSYGNGQTLFREVLLLADHTSYHTGEIIILRRLLNNWKK
jgi:hypothetical protein